MLVNKTSHKFTGKLGQKVDKTKCVILFLGMNGWRFDTEKW